MTRFPWILIAASLVLLPLAAFAGDAAGLATAADEAGGHWWKGLLQGIWGGILASLAGYAKNRNTRSGQHEAFGIQYLVMTAIFGAVIGLASGIFKLNPTDLGTSAVASPVFAGLTILFEIVMKAIWRNAVVKVKEMMEDFKAGTANPTPPAPPPQ